MEIQYDENLAANPFFKKIRQDHSHFIHLASLQNLVICVPRLGSIASKQQLDEQLLMTHILVPNEELPESHFTCANDAGKVVLTTSKKILFENTVGGQLEVNILFEEVFYTKDLMRYKVWCIDRPFVVDEKSSRKSTKELESPNDLFYVQNLNDAVQLIWTEVQSKQILRKIDTSIANFRKNNRSFGNTDLQKLRNNTHLLYNHCVDVLLLNRRLKEKCRNDAFLLKNLKIAVEQYMINALYSHLFDAITLCTTEENEKFNKTIRSLSEIQLAEFNLDPRLYDYIPVMKLEIMKLDSHTTVLDKLNCLKRAINVISEKYNKMTENGKILTTDDVIPVLIFVIIKSGMTHWMSNLYFLKEFSFTDVAGNNFGAENFLVATLEAAITFILTHDFAAKDILGDIPAVDCEKFESKDQFLAHFFLKIKENDEKSVEKLLKPFNKLTGCIDPGTTNPYYEMPVLQHHPLCACSECESKISDSIACINSKGPHGLSAIFIPVIYGHPKILNLLLSYSADVNCCDSNEWTPLHYAASRGDQNSLLLLLHAGADLNAANVDKNSPLHICCMYGYANCAKALIYFSEHMKIKLALNGQNKHGDTAIHIASKWGFLEIVSTLLENGARIDIQNKFGHTAVSVSHSSKVRKIMHETFVLVPKTVEPELGPCSVQNICLTDEDLMDNATDNVVTKMEKVQCLEKAIADGDTRLALMLLNLQSALQDVPSCNCDPLRTCKRCISHKQVTNANNNNVKSTALDLNVQNPDGNTPLHLAAIHGNLNLAKSLLENGADTTILNKKHQTALHVAIECGRYQIIKAILKLSKVDIIDAVDSNGDTALIYAALSGDTKLVETILAFEPQLETKNANGNSALCLARENMFMGVVKLLEQASLKASKGSDDEGLKVNGDE
ncbi:ankyrin repeat domain-containing protein 27-like [Culicoides brevitarsis]|uniref:ankyrin repeat domain-containing protein 27-like n=1 Tax=Culicoides brevitarsis TaxID=469753 RepID=UPI00307B3933